MRLLFELADGRGSRTRCLEVPETLSAGDLQAAALEALAPRTSARHTEALAAPSFYVLHNRKPLLPRASGSQSSHAWRSIRELGFQPLDTVQLVPALRGGGGDGGSTCAESRSCYLEMYAQKKPEKVDPKDALLARWTTCQLSSQMLSPPCVIDQLGNLLNKEAVLRALQSKTMPGGLRHIRGLKDVIDIKLTEIPSLSDTAIVRFQCPISGHEFSGNFRFVVMRCCRHTLSLRALKELKAQAECPMCHVAGAERIPINGTEEEVLALRMQMEERRAKAKAEKARAKGGEQAPAAAVTGSEAARHEGGGKEANREHAVGVEAAKPAAGAAAGVVGVKRVGGLVRAQANGAGATPAAGPKEGGSVANGKSKDGERSAKKFKAGEHAPAGATKTVYASIFTSSRKTELKETYSCRSLPLGRN